MNFGIAEKVTPTAKDGVKLVQLSLTSDSGADLQRVKRVVYTLHPAFPSPVRVALYASTEFSTKFETWGKFTVRVRIVMKDETEQEITYALRINAPDIANLPANTAAKETFDLGQHFMDVNGFSYAIRFFQHALRDTAIDADLKQTIASRMALATYKDASAPAVERYTQALSILEDLVTWSSGAIQADAFGMIGAVHKRRWEFDGQIIHLERAKHGYETGWQLALRGNHLPELIYNAVNLAYLLDVLSDLEEKDAGVPPTNTPPTGAQARRSKASELRKQIIDQLTPEANRLLPTQPAPVTGNHENAWWYVATLVEAHAGRKEYPEATNWAMRLKDLDVPRWKRETFGRQLASLVRVIEKPLRPSDLRNTDGWKLLFVVLSEDEDAVLRSIIGKVGLALSGGGFRAALYHIGVLARLAELDVLRHIEVLSCVSGGSIIGAQYYLELRHLLMSKLDGDISRNDYVEIVRKIAGDFLAGVQTNIRTRVILNPIHTVRMLLMPNSYSRTERLGKLYEEQLFSRTGSDLGTSPKVNDFLIFPAAQDANGTVVPDESFSLRNDNWHRKNKVPILVLNATTLNTGNTWQFTASWMGEPPEGVDAEIGTCARLRRMYYGEAPPGYCTYSLGNAVAASSCVPGMFNPIVLPQLFDGEEVVRLVDGGVHDNQGVGSLLEQECQVMLVSDASGQMAGDADPSGNALGVVCRANDILQARVREAQYRELQARQSYGSLRAMMFIHLKMGLHEPQRTWIGYADELSAITPFARSDEPSTQYGILKSMQQKLSAIRTDLDSFSDIEAFSLMLSGYRMTGTQFPLKIEWPYPIQAEDGGWLFLAAQDPLAGRSPGLEIDRFSKHLEIARYRAFRVWELSPFLRVLRWVFAAGAVVVAGTVLFALWNYRLLVDVTIGTLVVSVASLALVAGVTYIANKSIGPWAGRAINYRATLRRWAIGIVVAIAGMTIARLHLKYFDALFLKLGRIDRRPSSAPSLNS